MGLSESLDHWDEWWSRLWLRDWLDDRQADDQVAVIATLMRNPHATWDLCVAL
jgi:hypothetical protein